MKEWWLGLAVAGVVWLTGCGGRSTSSAAADGSAKDGSVEPAPLSFAQYCAELARLRCEREAGCCSARGYQVNLERCAANTPDYALALLPDGSSFSCAAAEPEGFDRARAGRCVAKVRQLTNGCASSRHDDPAYLAAIAECTPRVDPSNLPGPFAVCAEGVCAAPPGQVSKCYWGTDGAPNRCSEAVRAGRAGDGCGYGCLPELVCDINNRCQAPAPDGSGCEINQQCASGTCVHESGSCEAPPPLSEERCKLLDDLAEYELYQTTTSLLPPLAVSSGYVVWGVEPWRISLRRASKTGSDSSISLLPEPPSPLYDQPLAFDDDYGYFLSSTGTSAVVNRFALETGKGSIVAEIAVDRSLKSPTHWLAGKQDGALLLVVDRCESVLRVDLTSGAVETSAALPAPSDAGFGPSVAFLDGDRIYCANSRRRAVFDRHGEARVLTETGAANPARSIAAFAGQLYALAWNGVFQLDLASNVETPLDLPLALDNASSASDQHNLVLDAGRERLYWMVSGGIQSYAPRTGSFSMLAGGASFTHGAHLADDAEFFYWATPVGVFRRRKEP